MQLTDAVRKAALLLDLKGDHTGAEQVLRAALGEQRGRTPERIRALVLLGELLLLNGNAEGLVPLKEALADPIPSEWDDVLAREIDTARRLVAEHDS